MQCYAKSYANVMQKVVLLQTKNRRSGQPPRGEHDDAAKSCPFNSADHFDADIHDALANMRRLDGSIW